MPRGMRGKCIDGINSFTCVCIKGYHGDNCQFKDKYAENPCRYEGICYRNYSNFNVAKGSLERYVMEFKTVVTNQSNSEIPIYLQN